jgi:hypothetical protein
MLAAGKLGEHRTGILFITWLAENEAIAFGDGIGRED